MGAAAGTMHKPIMRVQGEGWARGRVIARLERKWRESERKRKRREERAEPNEQEAQVRRRQHGASQSSSSSSRRRRPIFFRVRGGKLDGFLDFFQQGVLLLWVASAAIPPFPSFPLTLENKHDCGAHTIF